MRNVICNTISNRNVHINGVANSLCQPEASMTASEVVVSVSSVTVCHT